MLYHSAFGFTVRGLKITLNKTEYYIPSSDQVLFLRDNYRPTGTFTN